MILNTRHRLSIAASISILMLGLVGFSAVAQAVTVTDDFSVSHDYSGGNVSGSIWGGVIFNNGSGAVQNASIVSANSNLSNAGRLTLSTAGGDWEATGDDGFFLFRWVNGDFTATVQVVSANVVNYHDLGLMARAGNDADGGAGEDYVAGRYYAAGGVNSLRSTDGGSTVNTNGSGLHSFIKLERAGNLFTYTWADDSAFTLNVGTNSVLRSDLDGLALQVGIWQATFTGNVGTATFDNFALIETVPEPSVGALVCIGALGLLRRRCGAEKC